MTPRQRQVELREAGFTQQDIADELGKSAMTVSQVIRNKGVSRLVMDTIADKIGLPTRMVFPEYFGLTPSVDIKSDIAAEIAA